MSSRKLGQVGRAAAMAGPLQQDDVRIKAWVSCATPAPTPPIRAGPVPPRPVRNPPHRPARRDWRSAGTAISRQGGSRGRSTGRRWGRQGTAADDGHQVVHAKELAIIGAPHQISAARNSQGGGGEEGGTDMARLKRRALHQRRPQSELRKVEGEADDNQGGATRPKSAGARSRVRRINTPTSSRRWPRCHHATHTMPRTVRWSDSSGVYLTGFGGSRVPGSPAAPLSGTR